MMLKKLQRRFVGTNMLLISIVLIVVFFVVALNNYSNNLLYIDRALHNSLNFVRDNRMPISRMEDHIQCQAPFRPNNKIATITVSVNRAGQITSIFQDLTMVPQDRLDNMVYQAMNQPGSRGFLGKKTFRYLKMKTGGATYISFASMAESNATMKRLLLISGFLTLLGVVVLFFISLFMSHLAIKPVKRAWKQQQQFLADASHELHTPLTVILANNNILLSSPEAPIKEQKKWLLSTQAEATHMKELINNLLYLARSDNSTEPLPTEKIAFSEVLMDNILQFEPIAFENQIALKTYIDLHLWIVGNPTQIRQLLHILMDNALKYTNPGGFITVKLSRHGNLIRLDINNTGEPIPLEDQPHLFERFYRSDKARTQRSEKGGYGLGLSIAKTIVEKHKGKISVVSDKRNGTTFSVLFKAQ